MVWTMELVVVWPRGTLYPQKLAITSPTSGGRSVGIVRSQTQTMEFSLVFQDDMFGGGGDTTNGSASRKIWRSIGGWWG
jgi:hypothetical protein